MDPGESGVSPSLFSRRLCARTGEAGADWKCFLERFRSGGRQHDRKRSRRRRGAYGRLASIPSRFIFFQSADRVIPSMDAARDRLPPVN